MIRSGETVRQGVVLVAGFAVIVCYGVIFSPFLPGKYGFLGHDYGFTLPQLLDGYVWFKKNGVFPVYWFSPSFCGGIPVFAHPISYFYSAVQLLTFWTGPLPAIGLSFLLFGALGFWGFYVLIHRTCDCSRSVAFLCAVLFLFNGFYWSKVLIGALIYIAFMLIPWVVICLLPTGTGQRATYGRAARNMVAAGLMISYMVYSGTQTLLPAILLSIVITGCLLCFLYPQRFFPLPFISRFAGACLIALGLSAAKLSAVLHFVANFPRNHYLLPQIDGMGNLVRVVAGALWGVPMDALAREAMVNTQFFLGRHEFEFGVGPVPFVVIIGAAGVLLFRRLTWRKRISLISKHPLLFMATVVLAGVPLALNLYTPDWNAFLKKVPVIGSSSQNVRWFSVYIPALVLLTGVAMERTISSRRLRTALVLAGVATTIFFNMVMDRTYYSLEQSYSGVRVQQAYYAIKQGAIDPKVTHISAPVDNCGRPGAPIYRNDAFIYNHSQMFCYEASFGYGLEMLPFGSLHLGPVMDVANGVFNIKNPVCYVFPGANGCRPGDHFTADQKEAVLAFTHYRPFPFAIPLAQRAANWTTACCLLCCIFLLAADGILRIWRKLRGIAS